MRAFCGTILAAAVAATALDDSLGNIGDVRLCGRASGAKLVDRAQ